MWSQYCLIGFKYTKDWIEYGKLRHFDILRAKQQKASDKFEENNAALKTYYKVSTNSFFHNICGRLKAVF